MGDQELYLAENYEVVTRPIECNSLENQMVAMGKALMRAKKQMTLEERKLLIMALTKIKWSKKENPMEVVLSKIEVAEVLNWKYDASERSRYIRKLAANLMRHSLIQIDGTDKDEWDDGFLVPRFRSTKGDVHIFFAEQFRPLLENLTKDKDFVTIWANDIYGFNSIYAYLLFEELRLHCDTSKTNWRTYSTKQLKDLFGIPKDGKGSYMHYDKAKGKDVFDRSNFEKKVLDVAIEEINRGQMLHIQPFVGMEATVAKPNKLYAKIKKNGFVSGYQFKYVVYTSVSPSAEQSQAMIEDEQLEHAANDDAKHQHGRRQMTDAEKTEYDRLVSGAEQMSLDLDPDEQLPADLPIPEPPESYVTVHDEQGKLLETVRPSEDPERYKDLSEQIDLDTIRKVKAMQELYGKDKLNQVLDLLKP